MRCGKHASADQFGQSISGIQDVRIVQGMQNQQVRVSADEPSGTDDQRSANESIVLGAPAPASLFYGQVAVEFGFQRSDSSSAQEIAVSGRALSKGSMLGCRNYQISNVNFVKHSDISITIRQR